MSSDLDRIVLSRLSEQMLGPAALARKQARQAGIPEGMPFTRSIDHRTGRVTITARRRTRAERTAAFERLAKSMRRSDRTNADRRAAYARLAQDRADRAAIAQPATPPVPMAASRPRQRKL